MLIDSHAHIYDEMFVPSGGARAIIDGMDADGLKNIVCVGCDVPTSEMCVKLAEENERIYATVGVHPYDADTVTPENTEKLRTLAKSSKKVVAIGEIGLDFHRTNSARELQKTAMEIQYELARELDLPMVFHIRDGYGEFVEFVRKREFPKSAVIHCYSSSAELAEYFVKKGFYISFSGTVTYGNAANLKRAAAVVPLARLLVETDSPYLTPEPRRYDINYPKNVALVAACIAEIKGVKKEEVERATVRNAQKVFGIK